MKRPKRVLAGLVAVAALAALLAVNPDASAITVDSHRAAPSVTLITGDRVTVLPGDAYAVEPGPGREAMTYQTRWVGGHLRVVPGDAAALLAAGRLDPRLFDITTLLAYGYDDRRADLPLIVTNGTARAAVPTGGATVDRQLPKVGAVAIRQDRRKPGEFWQSLTRGVDGGAAARGLPPSVGRIWLDGIRKPSLDTSVPQIGAPAAWESGYTGKGVTVAVLDTGVDGTHPDLAGKVTARRNFTEGVEDDRDHAGHGTHVASTIAGAGATYRGVAPDSTLLDAKVCGVDGCAESWILAGMEWACAEQHAKVVNLSLGGSDGPEIDPLEQAVDTLTKQYGTLFVVAAGNDGPYPSSISSPASADVALAVGAVDGSDQVAAFSSRGPLPGGGVKPDITAPGVDITAARAVQGGYATMSGTSMATPHVSGTAALLAQRNPDWTPGRLKSALLASARPTPGTDAFRQGAGRVAAAAALSQTVTAEPANISFGEQAWPHTDDEPLTREVTYHNAGGTPVTLELSTTSDTFIVNPTTVTVPAGGAATATVTADTRVSGPDGVLTGAVTATGGGQSARTLLAVAKEVESYDVTIEAIGRDGAPHGFPFIDLYRLDGPGTYFPTGSTIRLPRGRYLLVGTLFGRTPGDGTTLLTQPVLDVSAERTATLDARLGRPSAVTVPDASATPRQVHAGFAMPVNGEPLTVGQTAASLDRLYTTQIGPAPAGFVSHLSAQFVRGTDVYQIGHHESGRLISGHQRAYTAADLATIRVQASGGDANGLEGGWFAVSRLPGQADQSPPSPVFAPLPAEPTWFVNTDGGIQWRAGLYQSWSDPDSGDQYLYAPTVGPWTRYRAGATYREVWNQAVFAPVLPGPDDIDTGVRRAGDRITVDVSPYGDGAGRTGRERDRGSTALFRDGVEVGRSDLAGSGEFTVPAGASTYRLELHAARGTPYHLSTRVDVAWTFRSNRVDHAVLPLWTVRFSPKLDRYNTAPAGRPFPVPVVAVPAPGSKTGRSRPVKVEVSYDDGATWATAPVAGDVALVRHPAGSGFVSLRATATDSADNTVTQTVIHAYRYG